MEPTRELNIPTLLPFFSLRCKPNNVRKAHKLFILKCRRMLSKSMLLILSGSKMPELYIKISTEEHLSSKFNISYRAMALTHNTIFEWIGLNHIHLNSFKNSPNQSAAQCINMAIILSECSGQPKMIASICQWCLIM